MLTPDEKALNQKLKKAFQALKLELYNPRESGDDTDKRLREIIEVEADLISVPSKVWKKPGTKKSPSAYKEACNNVRNDEFSFKTGFSTPFVVDKPNGSQRWPDCLVVFGTTSIPIEFKRSEDGKVLWNSGLPKPGGIYVFNGKDGLEAGTTFFMGQALLPCEVSRSLRVAAEANKDVAKRFNEILESDNWSLYARPMFNCLDRPLSSGSRSQREEDALLHLENFKWL